MIAITIRVSILFQPPSAGRRRPAGKGGTPFVRRQHHEKERIFVKKLLAILLSAALLVSTLPGAFAAGYDDTAGHWAQEQIDSFSQLGLIKGYNGAFRPDDSITRGEMAVILDRMMDYQTAADNRFTDLDDNFYTDAILKPETYYARNLLSVMPEQYKVSPEDSIYTKIQTVVDYVSGMTDSYALNLYRKIKGIDLPEIR